MAIIGSNGSGKSTIANLILRLHDIDSGEICINGVDIRNFSQNELRNKIGYVPQKALLFSGTIKDNLTVSNKEATREDMRMALKISQAETFVDKLPMGLEYLQYVNQVSEPVTQASYVIMSLQSAIAGSERVFELLDEEEEDSDNSLNEFESPITEGRVSFENVRFGYTEEKTLIKNLNIEVKPNEMVAIVGPTGGGKTTLINLIMRFYELRGGAISIDGVNITDIPRNALRRQIGMVLQDTWLFEGTIAENIAYGKMDATCEEIITAAKAACCDHFIRTLEHGYDTIISSEAANISQGQMQLLTIARAMLTNPSIMILDEATSSVDTRTEVEIQKALSRLMKDKTSFVIAHRLSTIQNADMILVVKDGDIVERGNHESLLVQNGFYASLYYS